MKTVIYSTQTSDFEAGVEYRNPAYFSAPLGNPDQVRVIGDWPAVVAAYEAIGVSVETDDPAQTVVTASQVKRMNKAALVEFLASNEMDAPEGATNPELIALALTFAAEE